MYYFLSYLSAAMYIILFPIWYFGVKYGILSIDISKIQPVYVIIIVPLLLVVTNVYFLRCGKIKWYTSGIVVITSVFIASIVKYFYWGVKTGSLFNPDAETVMVSIYVFTVFPIIITFLGIGICLTVLKLFSRH